MEKYCDLGFFCIFAHINNNTHFMETKTLILIALVIAFIILFAISTRIFFYKRTMHKIHQYSGLNTADIYRIVTPSSTIWTEIIVNLLKWAVVIALFFYNWIVAVVCVIICFVLPMVLPEEDDYKNMIKMRDYLKGKKDSQSIAMDNMIKDIISKQWNE